MLQTRGAYLRNDEAVVLVECITVELGPPRHFFVTVEKKKDRVTVRCFQHPSPPRSEAVKKLVAQVARMVLAIKGQVDRTNLEVELG